MAEGWKMVLKLINGGRGPFIGQFIGYRIYEPNLDIYIYIHKKFSNL